MTSSDLRVKMLIDGQFIAGEGEAEKVLNPATGELLASVPEATVDQVHKAVSAAHRAFDGWSDTTPMERSRLLLKLADPIEAKAETFARLESLNCATRSRPSSTASATSPALRAASAAPWPTSTSPATPA